MQNCSPVQSLKMGEQWVRSVHLFSLDFTRGHEIYTVSSKCAGSIYIVLERGLD